jgi:hypothetical protein
VVKTPQLDEVWELVSGTGKPFYTGGGTYTLNGSACTEHMDFASDAIAAGLITQTGTLSNRKPLSEVWKRAK